MDMETEQHLMWIAQEGLLEEPPAEWKPCKSPDGEIYYFNFKTGESMWDHPCDESFRELYREQRELSLMAARQVRKTPSWPRSWANFSLLYLYSHGNAWVNLHHGLTCIFWANLTPFSLEGSRQIEHVYL
jgi:hypothetical protein